MRDIDLLRQAVTADVLPWLIVAWALAAILPYLIRPHRKGR